MSKEKQINEITAFLKECERRDYLLITRPSALAEHLYNEGYRKRGRRMKTLNYTCRHCGGTNTITSIFKWMFTPHFGASKWLKCKHCDSMRHFMKRQDWNHPWIDWI